MIDIKLLEQLCLCNGISGDEGNVRNLIINEIKYCADDIKTDNLGNLIVFKKGKKSAKSLKLPMAKKKMPKRNRNLKLN